MAKPIGFRPTEKALEKINAYKTRHPEANPSLAINRLLESISIEKGGKFLELPPFLKCPYEFEAWEETAKVLVRCLTCEWKKVSACPAWKHEISMRQPRTQSTKQTSKGDAGQVIWFEDR